MAKDLTPGEIAATHLTLGEALVQLVKDSGLLKPKRRRTVKRRKRRTKAEMVAARAPKKAKPKVAARTIEPQEEEEE